jgi:hypothetical protein
MKCQVFEEELADMLSKHDCVDGQCPVPGRETDFRNSIFWFVTVAYQRLDLTAERLSGVKQIIEEPNDLPSSLLRDWEQHAIEAAELLGKARARREKAEFATRDLSFRVDGQPS